MDSGDNFLSVKVVTKNSNHSTVYNRNNIPKGQQNQLIFEVVRGICLQTKKIEKNTSLLLKIRIEVPLDVIYKNRSLGFYWSAYGT